MGSNLRNFLIQKISLNLLMSNLGKSYENQLSEFNRL